MVGICPAAEDQRHVGPPDWSGGPGLVLPCMALYCSGVMCSKPGGGTSQYLHARFFLLLLGEWLEGQLRWALFPRRQPCPRHSPALLVVTGGAAAVSALVLAAVAPLLAAAALLSAATRRAAPAPPAVPLPLSL